MDINDVKTIAVLGAGDMGHGIAEVALMAGYKVFLRDTEQAYVDRGVERIHQSLEKLVSKGKVETELYAKIKEGLLVPCVNLDEAVKTADLVIEAVPEIMDLKKQIFRAVDALAPAHILLATNTSTMKVSDIASATNRPEKVLGLHYFNPAVLMKLVEVIQGDKTSDETMATGMGFVEKMGKIPVQVKDVPGFIVNRVQAPAGVLLNCYLDAGMDPESVDAVMRSLGMPMGPFETMDFTGLDIACHGSYYFAKSIHPDFSIGKKVAKLVQDGNKGKKTGKGIFDWSQGRPTIDLTKTAHDFDPMDLVAVNANEAMKLIELKACKIEDIDTAIVYATGNPMGLLALVRGMEPGDLAGRLNNLADTFGKEIFRPSRLILQGAYQ